MRKKLIITCAVLCLMAAGFAQLKYPFKHLAAMLPVSGHRAFAELRRLIDERYSYKDLRQVNWDVLFEKYRPELEKAGDPAALAKAVAGLVANAHDVHIRVYDNERPVRTFTRRIAGGRQRADEALLKNTEKLSPEVLKAEIGDDIGYIAIDSLVKDAGGTLAAAMRALDMLLAKPALIIDLRENSGGSETLAEQFAGRFISKDTPYAKHRLRDPAFPGGWGPVRTRNFSPTAGSRPYTGKVAILMGPQNTSSCESFLLMLRAAKNCVLIGEPSFGSSGRPVNYPLSGGVSIDLPSWEALDLAGNPIEGKGIRPDIMAKEGAGPGTTPSLLKFAAEFIRKKKI